LRGGKKMLWIIVSFFVGGFLGFLFAVLGCAAAKRNETREEKK